MGKYDVYAIFDKDELKRTRIRALVNTSFLRLLQLKSGAETPAHVAAWERIWEQNLVDGCFNDTFRDPVNC